MQTLATRGSEHAEISEGGHAKATLLLAIARGWIVSGGLPFRFLPSNRLSHCLKSLGFDAKKRSAAAAPSRYARSMAEERAMARPSG